MNNSSKTLQPYQVFISFLTLSRLRGKKLFPGLIHELSSAILNPLISLSTIRLNYMPNETMFVRPCCILICMWEIVRQSTDFTSALGSCSKLDTSWKIPQGGFAFEIISALDTCSGGGQTRGEGRDLSRYQKKTSKIVLKCK